MRPRIDEIEIPLEGLMTTEERCSELIQELPRESRLSTIMRLYRLELTTYIQGAVSGIIIMLILAYFTPNIRIATVSLYFFLLGISAVYEIYKQSIYDIDELISTTYLNKGRCFLYKCILCSFVQLLCFLLIVMIEVGIFHEQLTLVILNSILPIYLIQCLAILFDHYIHTRKSVMLLYLIAYAVYWSIARSTVINLQIFTIETTVCVLLISIVILSILLIIQFLKIKKEDICLWN